MNNLRPLTCLQQLNGKGYSANASAVEATITIDPLPCCIHLSPSRAHGPACVWQPKWQARGVTLHTRNQCMTDRGGLKNFYSSFKFSHAVISGRGTLMDFTLKKQLSIIRIHVKIHHHLYNLSASPARLVSRRERHPASPYTDGGAAAVGPAGACDPKGWLVVAAARGLLPANAASRRDRVRPGRATLPRGQGL